MFQICRECTSGMRRSGIRPFDPGDTNVVMNVPFAFAAFLRDQMIGMLPPRGDGRFITPVRHGNSEAVSAASTFDTQKAWHRLGELNHALRCRFVILITRGAARREDHGIIRQFKVHELWAGGAGVEMHFDLINGKIQLDGIVQLHVNFRIRMGYLNVTYCQR
jgi:hypothetical protein